MVSGYAGKELFDNIKPNAYLLGFRAKTIMRSVPHPGLRLKIGTTGKLQMSAPDRFALVMIRVSMD